MNRGGGTTGSGQTLRPSQSDASCEDGFSSSGKLNLVNSPVVGRQGGTRSTATPGHMSQSRANTSVVRVHVAGEGAEEGDDQAEDLSKDGGGEGMKIAQRVSPALGTSEQAESSDTYQAPQESRRDPGRTSEGGDPNPVQVRRQVSTSEPDLMQVQGLDFAQLPALRQNHTTIIRST